MKKRLLSLLLAFVMLSSCMIFAPSGAVSAADAAWTSGGSGTAADPYLINSAIQFRTFMSNVTVSGSGKIYSGKYFKLTSDIKITSNSYTLDEATGLVKVTNSTGTLLYCIGTGIAGTTYCRGYVSAFADWEDESVPGKIYAASSTSGTLTDYTGSTPSDWAYASSENRFAGTLDFDGHSVSGLYINESTYGLGLMGKVRYNAVFKNVTLKNGFVVGRGQTGAFAGAVYGEGIATFEYITNESVIVSGYSNATGGIVGISTGGGIKLVGCRNYADIYGKFNPASAKASRFATVGGIVGQVRGAEIIACYNSGDIFGGGSYVGGIVGLSDTGGINNTYVGSTTIVGCVNLGKVESKYSYQLREDVTEYDRISLVSGYTGGIVGFADPYWSNLGTVYTIKNCISIGEIDVSCYSGSLGTTKTAGYLFGRMNSIYSGTEYNGPCGASFDISDNVYLKSDDIGIGTNLISERDNISVICAGNNAILESDANFVNTVYSVANDANSWIYSSQYGKCYITVGSDGLPTVTSSNVFADNAISGMSGKGTEDDPVIIDSLADLIALRNAVNAGNHFAGVYFKITTDIDLNPSGTVNKNGTTTGSVTSWTPIGDNVNTFNPVNYFAGNIVGDNNGEPAVISDLYINASNTDGKLLGLFGANLGSISNIKINNAYVYGKRYASVVAGSNFGTIDSVEVANAAVVLEYTSAPTEIGSSVAPAGGISAQNYGTINKCVNKASVTSNYDYAGGIVGFNGGKVNLCRNDGDVYGVASIGGIAGHNASENTLKSYGSVEYCENTATIRATASHVGGIVGWTRWGGGIEKCYNAGAVYQLNTATGVSGYSTSAFGGILGCGNVNDLRSGNTVVVNNCVNTGNVYSGSEAQSSRTCGWIGGYSALKLKASPNKQNGNGIHDGVYVKIGSLSKLGMSTYTYPSELVTVPEYNCDTELALLSANVTSATTIELTFSAPVQRKSSFFTAIRYCTVSASGVPNLKYDGSTPMQVSGTITFDGTNTAIFTLSNLSDVMTAPEGIWETDGVLDGTVPLLCIEGLNETSGNTVGYIDNIVSKVSSYVSYKDNYGLATSTYASNTISQSKDATGENTLFLNELFATDIYGQKLGTDACPVMFSDYAVYECSSAGGLFRTPSTPVANKESGFLGYVDSTGTLYAPGSLVSSKCVHAKFGLDFVVESGASVKVCSDDRTGIRWSAKLDQSSLGSLQMLSKGIIIVPTSYITGEYAIVANSTVRTANIANEFTIEELKSKGLKYIDCVVDGYNGDGTFAASVINLLENNYSLEFAARGYVKVRYSDGTEGYLYSGWEFSNGDQTYSYSTAKDINSRSPGAIARLALADVKTASNSKYQYEVSKTLDNFIKAHSSEYAESNYYSPYSLYVRNKINSFILANPEVSEEEHTLYPYIDNTSEYEDMKNNVRRWVYDQLDTGDGAIFSASLKTIAGLGGNNTANGTVSFAALSARWTKTVNSTIAKDGTETIVATYNDSASGLRFVTTVIIYADNPTVDIKTEITNVSSKRSPVIQNLYSIDATYNITCTNGDITLNTLYGSDASFLDFDYIEKTLTTTPMSFCPTNGGTDVDGDGKNDLGGRWKGVSTVGEGWPYFGFVGDNRGILMAIGYSAQWSATFSKDNSGNVNLRAGQQYISTFLNPGEMVDTPRIVLTYYEGDEDYGHNVWRDNMIKHYSPDDDSSDDVQSFTAPIAINFWGGVPNVTVREAMTNFAAAGTNADILWFDTGWNSDYASKSDLGYAFIEASKAQYQSLINSNKYWYFNQSDKSNGASSWNQLIGCYKVNSLLFPNGLIEISDILDELNATYGTHYTFMLWYMIEANRVGQEINVLNADGTVSTVTTGANDVYPFSYPGDFYNSANGANIRLDDDAVRDKFINYYKDMIANQGVDNIRLDCCASGFSQKYTQDANYVNELGISGLSVSNPSSENTTNGYLSANNVRMGYTENKYNRNFYYCWDAIKEFYPTFFLDNTCSGGCRQDIEMVRRSMSLWRTDYNNKTHALTTGGTMIEENYYAAHQKMTENLSLWVPFSAIGVATHGDKYQARSYYSASTCILGFTGASAEGASQVKVLVDEVVELRPYWYGDYYMLLDSDYRYDNWQGYELYRKDWGEGVLFAIAREKCTQTEDESTANVLTKTFKLEGLVANGTYLVHDIDDKHNRNDYYATGYELMTNGIKARCEQRSIHIYKYTLQK